MKTIFDIFSRARQAGWKFGQVQRATEVGNHFTVVGEFSPIVSDGNKATFRNGASADGITFDILLYVEPGELPAATLAELEASYMVQSPEGETFNIVNAGTGFNQETGEAEHYELMLNAAEAEVEND